MRTFNLKDLIDGIVIIICCILSYTGNTGHFHPVAFLLGWGIGSVLVQIICYILDKTNEKH